MARFTKKFTPIAGIGDGTITNAKMDVDEGHNIAVIRKTATESVNNSATLQDDDDLVSASLPASTTWIFELVMRIISTTATPDGKFDVVLPAGATWYIGANANLAADETVQQITSASGDAAKSFGVSSLDRLIILKGWVKISTTAGTCQFRWAQTTATVESTSLALDAYMLLRRMV